MNRQTAYTRHNTSKTITIKQIHNARNPQPSICSWNVWARFSDSICGVVFAYGKINHRFVEQNNEIVSSVVVETWSMSNWFTSADVECCSGHASGEWTWSMQYFSRYSNCLLWICLLYFYFLFWEEFKCKYLKYSIEKKVYSLCYFLYIFWIVLKCIISIPNTFICILILFLNFKCIVCIWNSFEFTILFGFKIYFMLFSDLKYILCYFQSKKE